jgi:hypothetical protein
MLLDETTTNKKWLTIETIHKLIDSGFDLNDGHGFTIHELKRSAAVVNELDGHRLYIITTWHS